MHAFHFAFCGASFPHQMLLLFLSQCKRIFLLLLWHLLWEFTRISFFSKEAFFLKRSFSVLTNPKRSAIITIAGLIQGEMAEWLKALVLKTSDVERHRGFESLSLRQNRIDVEKYPRGRRGSPAKGVGWDNCREGSNPSFSAMMVIVDRHLTAASR